MAGHRPAGSSFRDPSGFIFRANSIVYRQVNRSYQSNYELLHSSGLYDRLVGDGLLVSHVESDFPLPDDEGAYKILRPQTIPFISYPYEWSFSQLKDAALATLKIQQRALDHGMILKDASAYNIQFLAGKPILIDTLSFEKHEEGRPWVAYKQFCQHFLTPLLLMSYRDVRLGQLLRSNIDGIPLDLTRSLLPRRSYLKFGLILHLHLHARAQSRHADSRAARHDLARKRLTKADISRICESLQSTIDGIRWDHGQTSWTNYYEGDSYEHAGFDDKRRLVAEYLSAVEPKCVWDLGANTGLFSRIASQKGIFTLSMDSDPGVVEANYLQAKREQDRCLHPLLIDLANPSAAIGWASNERDSLMARSNADCALALALIHHLAISNNVPLPEIAEFLAALAEWLIIEFVPKTDKKVQQLLAARKDIFGAYSQDNFESDFGEFYEIIRSQQIDQSERVLYLLRRK